MPQMADGGLLELTLAPVGRLGRDGRLEVGIEQFVGVELRAVTGQVEHLDVLAVVLEPGLHQTGVMHFQVVQHQEYLGTLVLLGILNQPLHEVDQDAGGHGALEDLEAHRAPVGDAGDDRQSLAALVDTNLGRLSDGRVTAPAHVVAAQAGLVGPVDLGPFGLGAALNLWVLLVKPAAHGRRLLFVGALNRFLRREAPAAKVQAHALQRQANAKALRDQQRHRLAAPQREVHLQLVRRVVDHQAANLALLLRAERARCARRATARLVAKRRGAAFVKALADVEHARARQSQLGRDGLVAQSLAPQFDDLPAPLLARCRAQFSHVDDFHLNDIGPTTDISRGFVSNQ